MKEIKAYKLSDGRIIDNEIDAIAAQKEIDIKEKLDYLCSEFLAGLETSELSDEIFRHRKEFIAALSNQTLNC
tara:strand:+ start:316 stop:534 length:219 start_codon:yes stop_codon:yes gene_type:complete